MDQTPISFDELAIIVGNKEIELFLLRKRVVELEKLLREQRGEVVKQAQ